ncbi:MAG: hypothetical protein BWY31_04276 [Lentisphaerae bacterium ADurb.Bin242]|nr:MAG: hypothetical protein BWY31_04276 [Lentisphaerae bacterium ADurb.Bin242]
MSSETNEITAGSRVTVKVGKNEITATVLEICDGSYRVRSTASSKEFRVRNILRSVARPETALRTGAAVESEPDVPNPAPESRKPEKPVKKMSLLDAAIEVLKTGGKPMNTRELVKAAVEQGLWIPTACKTPEQTLYGSIFREIATKEFPRIRKSAEKGKFEFAG